MGQSHTATAHTDVSLYRVAARIQACGHGSTERIALLLDGGLGLLLLLSLGLFLSLLLGFLLVATTFHRTGGRADCRPLARISCNRTDGCTCGSSAGCPFSASAFGSAATLATRRRSWGRRIEGIDAGLLPRGPVTVLFILGLLLRTLLILRIRKQPY
jgi:hypothetical protein